MIVFYYIVFICLHITYFYRILLLQCKIVKYLDQFQFRIQFYIRFQVIGTFSSTHFLSFGLNIFIVSDCRISWGNLFHWIEALYLKDDLASPASAWELIPNRILFLSAVDLVLQERLDTVDSLVYKQCGDLVDKILKTSSREW